MRAMDSCAALDVWLIEQGFQMRELSRVRCVVFLVWRRHRTRPWAGRLWLRVHVERQPQGYGAAAAMFERVFGAALSRVVKDPKRCDVA